MEKVMQRGKEKKMYIEMNMTLNYYRTHDCI